MRRPTERAEKDRNRAPEQGSIERIQLRMQKTTAAEAEMQSLVLDLTTMTIANHRGTLKDFVLLFKEKSDRYNKICPAGSKLPPDILKTFLKNSLATTNHFTQITTLESMEIQRGGVAMTYAHYYELHLKRG